MRKLMSFILLLWTFQIAGQPFVTTWRPGTGIDGSHQIIIPTKGGGYNYRVDWEQVDNPAVNGSTTNITGDFTISVPSEGIYRVSISGDFPRIYYYKYDSLDVPFSGALSEILTVEQWGDIEWTSMESAFFGAHKLTITALDAPDLSRVTSMNSMFCHANQLNSNINHWDVSHVTDMTAMFWDATYFNQPLDQWDVSNVTSMSEMFQTTYFNQPIGNWNVSKVTNMGSMFMEAYHFNQSLASWDVSNVSLMWGMFKRALNFNQPIGTWDVAAVTDMRDMLSYSGINIENYDQILIGWGAQNVNVNVPLGADGLKYCAGATAREHLIADMGWKITGDTKTSLGAPSASVIQPVCEGTSGTITVIAENVGDSYSFDDGLTFQTSNTKTGLSEGNYSVVVQNSAGCPSTPTQVHVNPPIVPPNPTISGSPIVCPNVTEVDYRASNDHYAYTWIVNGGILKTQQNEAIKVDWGPSNFNASVKAIGIDEHNCSTDTITFPVKIQIKLKPEIISGMDSVCYNFRNGVPYQSSYTNGSIYTWFTNGGTIVEGQTTPLAKINWADIGKFQLWVKEENTTSTDYCEGVSDTLDVTVFKDMAAITMNFVSVDYKDDKKVQIQWDATMLERISDLIVVSRRIAGSNDAWKVVATLEKNVQSFLDQDVQTDQNIYEYKVEGFNKCDEGLLTVIHNTIKLDGDKVEEQELIELNWNDYNGWDGVERYEIWRKLDGDTTFRLVDVTSGEITSYNGKHGGDGFVHVLRIKAKKANENTISWSNDFELDFENAIENIPNVITPNGDSKNEYFVIPKLDLYPDNYLNIYNRWGQTVYQRSNYRNDWASDNLPVGMYYYSLHLAKTNKTLKGWIHVIR